MRKARKRQPDASGIVRFLKRFETPEDLEQECYRRGVKGVRGDEFQCVVARLIEDEFPAGLFSELVEMRGRFLRDGFPRDGSPCVWYDAETKRCKHYEHRPDICRDEVNPGDEACLRWRAAVLPKEARRAD